MADKQLSRLTADQMDEEREKNIAYKYLCHLEESKKWLERVLNVELPCVEDFEENLRNGVVLARLVAYVSPHLMKNKRIYDLSQQRHKTIGLNFRHTENIHLFLLAITEIGLPKIFLPEVTDIYERKNVPKLIYCLHALSAHLFRLGMAPPIQDLFGKVQFDDEILSSVTKDLKRNNIVMPAFQKIGGMFNDDKIQTSGNDERNMEKVLVALNDAIDAENEEALLTYLLHPLLGLKHIYVDYLDKYLKKFSEVKKEKLETSLNKSMSEYHEPDLCDEILTLPEVQGYVLFVNAEENFLSLKSAVEDNDNERIENILIKAMKEVLNFEEKNINFYIEKVKEVSFNEVETDMCRNTLQNVINSGNEESAKALKKSRNLDALKDALIENKKEKANRLLKEEIFGIKDLKEFASLLYIHELQEHLEMTGDLTIEDIQSSVSVLNAVAEVTAAVDSGNLSRIWSSLLGSQCQLKSGTALNLFENLNSNLKTQYQRALVELRDQKLLNQGENALLTFADIQDCIDAVNESDQRHLQLIEAMEVINCCVDENSIKGLSESLKIILKEDISSEVAPLFLNLLKAEKEVKPECELWLQDVKNVANDVKFYLNQPQHGADLEEVNNEELKDVIELSGRNFETINNQKNELFSEKIALENRFIKIQACIRGFIVRQIIKDMNTAALIIQKWWRKIYQEKLHKDPITEKYKLDIQSIVKIQAIWRKKLVQKKLSNRKKIKRKAPQPPHRTRSMADATNDLISKLRTQVMESIKRNQQLERQVAEIDTKIGLLVRNRITIESLISDSKLNTLSLGKPKGIRDLSKEAKSWLDGYQQLFYLLQTRPEYLTRLITSSCGTSLSIQSTIMNLFNHGSTARDAYLILKLFETALKQEIASKFVSPFDAITGNTLVLKLAVGFARQTGGQNPLANILGPVIKEVLNDTVTLDTNPVEIYRRWINECESRSGLPSKAPKNVTQEEALLVPEVVDRLKNNIQTLKGWVKCFLDRLTKCFSQFPFALRFLAKTLRDGLSEKFPQASEKDVLKVVSHLIYYQFVNSAIVAPDAFHIINLPPETPLKAEQRRNLASIAKILQLAASKTGFGEDSRHLMQLNPFIIDCHEKMKQFSRSCCSVFSLEAHYHVSKYSEVMLTQRPRVYMTVAEICDSHRLIFEKVQIVAPEPTDVIHGVLQELGPVPTPATLLACSSEIAAQMDVGKTLLCLELDNTLFISDQEKLNAQLEWEREKSRQKEAQTKELHDLKCAQKRLDEKAMYFTDQLRYYQKYLESCLTNLTTPKKNHVSKCVQLSGAKLKEMGILLDLDGIPSQQLKNLQFEISNSKVSGIFRVKGRFMGIEVDSADIDIQQLLSLQFEGRAEMNLFGKARININLLIFFLNKKFLKKTVMNPSYRKLLNTK